MLIGLAQLVFDHEIPEDSSMCAETSQCGGGCVVGCVSGYMGTSE